MKLRRKVPRVPRLAERLRLSGNSEKAAPMTTK